MLDFIPRVQNFASNFYLHDLHAIFQNICVSYFQHLRSICTNMVPENNSVMTAYSAVHWNNLSKAQNNTPSRTRGNLLLIDKGAIANGNVTIMGLSN